MASWDDEAENVETLDGFKFGGFLLVVVYSEADIPCEAVGQDLELRHAKGNGAKAKFVLDSGLEFWDDPNLGTHTAEGTPGRLLIQTPIQSCCCRVDKVKPRSASD